MGISAAALSPNSISSSRMGQASDSAVCVSYLHYLVSLAPGVFFQGLDSFKSPSL